MATKAVESYIKLVGKEVSQLSIELIQLQTKNEHMFDHQ